MTDLKAKVCTLMEAGRPDIEPAHGPALKRTGAACAVAFCLISTCAHAETLYGFAGRCDSMTLADREVSRTCEDTAYSARFPNGRVGLIFLTEGRTHVAFSWAEKPGQDDVSGASSFKASVESVGFVVLSEVEQLTAKGLCAIGKTETFGKTDNLGTTFVCEATTDKGRFAVTFSAGRLPPKKLFGAPEPTKP